MIVAVIKFKEIFVQYLLENLIKNKSLTDTGLEKIVRYRTELAFCGQCHRLTSAHYLAASEREFQRRY